MIAGGENLKLVVGFLALIGFAVVMVFLAAIGLFAYDEMKRKLFGDEFATPSPPATSEASKAE